MKLESYVAGRWVAGSGAGRPFFDPVSGAELGRVDATGIDCEAAMNHARRVGGPALAVLSFAERAELLSALARRLAENRDRYGEIARRNSGNTETDAAIDIDGGIGTLKYYAALGGRLGDARMLRDGEAEKLTRAETFRGGHLWTTRPGAALHVNAFNFPSWGMWEKVAVALLAGMPAMVKPASATAWLAQEMVRDVVDADILPQGALSLLCGGGEGLVQAIRRYDCIAFTGSAATGAKLRGDAAVLALNPRLNIEADSVNATLIGPDVLPGSAVFDLAVREIVKALTVKAGQMCTNIRRIFVAAERIDAFIDAVMAELDKITIGDPANPAVRMGPLVSRAQQAAAFQGLKVLEGETRRLCGGTVPERLVDADPERGAFLAPTLLYCEDPRNSRAVHETEVFGPVATVMPFTDGADAAALATGGGGSLVASIFTDDLENAARLATVIAPTHGRVLVVDSEVGKAHTGHAIVMPQLVHGGPGRAGGGEELGGLRGLRFYMQRSGIQGPGPLFDRIARISAPVCL